MSAISAAWTNLVRDAATALRGAISIADDGIVEAARASNLSKDAATKLFAAIDLHALDVAGSDGARTMLRSAASNTVEGVGALRLGDAAGAHERLRSALFATDLLLP